MKAELNHRDSNFDIGTIDNLLPASSRGQSKEEEEEEDERTKAIKARKHHKELRKIDAVSSGSKEEGKRGNNVRLRVKHGEVKIAPHVVRTNLHPKDLKVEQRIHAAYKNQKFVGREYEDPDPTQPPTTTEDGLRTRNPQRRIGSTTPAPSRSSGETSGRKRKLVVKRPKPEAVREAEAIAARVHEFESKRTKAKKKKKKQQRKKARHAIMTQC